MHHLPGYKKPLGTKHVKQHNTLKALAVKWSVEKGLVPKNTKWYTINWEHGKVTEKVRNSSGTGNA